MKTLYKPSKYKIGDIVVYNDKTVKQGDDIFVFIQSPIISVRILYRKYGKIKGKSYSPVYTSHYCTIESDKSKTSCISDNDIICKL